MRECHGVPSPKGLHEVSTLKLPRRSAPGQSAVVEYDIAELYRRHAPAVSRRARRFLPPAEAEEMVHEVFLKVLEEPARIEGSASLATWMYRVTTHLCIDVLRKRARHARLIDAYGAGLADRDEGGTPEARAFLDQLWRTLDSELAMVGVLYYIDGMTTADIGRTLGVSDRTIANRLASLEAAARTAANDPARATTARGRS